MSIMRLPNRSNRLSLVLTVVLSCVIGFSLNLLYPNSAVAQTDCFLCQYYDEESGVCYSWVSVPCTLPGLNPSACPCEPTVWWIKQDGTPIILYVSPELKERPWLLWTNLEREELETGEVLLKQEDEIIGGFVELQMQVEH